MYSGFLFAGSSNSSQLHDNRSLINKHLTFTLRHDPQTGRITTRFEYSSIATAPFVVIYINLAPTQMIDETEKPRIPPTFTKRAARYNEFACKVIFALIILCWSEMENNSKCELLEISKMNGKKCYYFIIFLKPSPIWLSKIFRKNWSRDITWLTEKIFLYSNVEDD